MLMGRNTWDSFGGRPLKNRVNIVVTRQKDFEAEGAVVVGDIQEGIELARKAGEEELFILGGGEIFKQTMDIANRIYLTRIYHTFDATVHFPAIDENEWKIVHEDKRHSDEQHKYNYTFFTYERR